MTSPSFINTRGTSPPIGVYESCIEQTDPLEVAVTEVAHMAEEAIPKRTSLPSMLPPGCSGEAICVMPIFVKAGLPACSEETQVQRNGTKMIVIVTPKAQPCRVSPIILPKV